MDGQWTSLVTPQSEAFCSLFFLFLMVRRARWIDYSLLNVIGPGTESHSRAAMPTLHVSQSVSQQNPITPKPSSLGRHARRASFVIRRVAEAEFGMSLPVKVMQPRLANLMKRVHTNFNIMSLCRTETRHPMFLKLHHFQTAGCSPPPLALT